MGTINYGHSKIITLGVKPYDFDDMKEEYMDVAIDKENVTDDDVYWYIGTIERTDFEEAEITVNDYNFEYFNVALKSGYYDGFYLDIEPNYDLYLDEADAVCEEALKLKKLLLDLVEENFFVEVYPGWVTTYKDYKTTKRDIEYAIAGFIEDVNNERSGIEV